MNALQELADLSVWLKQRADVAEGFMNAKPVNSNERVAWSHSCIAFNDTLKEVGLRIMRIEQGIELPDLDKLHRGQLRFVERMVHDSDIELPRLMRILQIYEYREGNFGWYDVPLVEDAEGT